MERTVFLGTGAFAADVLRALSPEARAAIPLVVTFPPRPAGRGREPRPSPVALAAAELGLHVSAPESANEGAGFDEIASLRPSFLLVCDYGAFIRSPLRAVATREILNIHPSLLPRWRGATPLQRTLAEGDATCGVTVLRVTKDLDAGDIFAQKEFPLEADETLPTLSAKLARAGAALFEETARAIEAGTACRVPQDGTRATHAGVLSKSDGFCDFSLPAAVYVRRIRAFDPWPGVFTTLPNGRLLKILSAAAREADGGREPAGTVVACSAAGVDVRCGDGSLLRLAQVGPAGKKAMCAAAWVCGRGVSAGERLGGGMP
ncbi:MAG: methionyl-tRNA formyltransferase [Kiritimatiellae bacterium]|nr:methionyl-tRNA formyltransferase [Kiritimatiellia bacterium]